MLPYRVRARFWPHESIQTVCPINSMSHWIMYDSSFKSCNMSFQASCKFNLWFDMAKNIISLMETQFIILIYHSLQIATVHDNWIFPQNQAALTIKTVTYSELFSHRHFLLAYHSALTILTYPQPHKVTLCALSLTLWLTTKSNSHFTKCFSHHSNLPQRSTLSKYFMEQLEFLMRCDDDISPPGKDLFSLNTNSQKQLSNKLIFSNFLAGTWIWSSLQTTSDPTRGLLE